MNFYVADNIESLLKIIPYLHARRIYLSLYLQSLEEHHYAREKLTRSEDPSTFILDLIVSGANRVSVTESCLLRV